MSSTTNLNQSEWNISTDIYSIVDNINKLKARYVDDVNETTLSLGIFGFLGDTEAKKIQTATIMAGELGNEMFPARAKLNKNVLAHAIYCNVEGINAVPATLTVNIGVKESDLDVYMANNEFVFEASNGIYMRQHEFHLDYDIHLKRFKSPGSDNWLYTAEYDMSEINPISDVRNIHLLQPVARRFGNDIYVFFTCTLHQTSTTEITDTVITDSIIDNESYSFGFTDQLAAFEVYITDKGKTTRLTPLFYGSPIETGVENYCWYLYMNDSTIRIGFDTNSYIPGINSQIRIVVRTTSGASGNFKYADSEDNDIFADFVSPYTRNKKITCLVRCATSSENGTDRKSIEQLKALIPKMAMSRGYITTETDLNNYFNLISTDDNMIKLQKKVDNQLERVWYAYYLLKEDNNVIPMNTFNIKVKPEDEYLMEADEGRYVIPAGTCFVYDPALGYATYIPENEIPKPFSAEYFNAETKLYYYKSIYNILLNEDPLYCSKYLSLVSYDRYFNYKYTNQEVSLGFLTITNHIERHLLDDKDTYTFTFTISQNINADFGMLTLDSETGAVIGRNIECLLVLYQNGRPYRYQMCELEAYSDDTYTTKWTASIHTTNRFDSENKLEVDNLYEIGMNSTMPGYIDYNCEAELFIAAKLPDGEVINDPDRTLFKINRGLIEYSLLDIYTIEGGIDFFYNFTDILNTRVIKNSSANDQYHLYDIFGIPMVGYHYFQSEDNVAYLINQITDKRNYISHCLRMVENNMNIDFKFYNTYGESATFHNGSKEQDSIGDLSMNFKFRLKVAATADGGTKDSVLEFVKSYIEDLHRDPEIHIPNLLHAVKEEFGDSIVYFEFMNYNDNRLGINHIELRDVIDPHVVPEFINVRNEVAEDGYTLRPCIDIETVYE